MTIYILEGFFAQLPQDLFDATRMDGYSDLEIFLNRGRLATLSAGSATQTRAPGVPG